LENSARATTILLLALAWPFAASGATVDDLEEATPIEAPAAPAEAPTTTHEAPYRYRGYGLLEWANRIPGARNQKTRDLSLVEANASGTWNSGHGLQWFGDVTGTYFVRAEEGLLRLNQTGLRYRTGPWEVAVGRERARKSPGLVISPSDFLFPNDSLPGMRELREGVWLARGSWQVPGHSADAIYLHNLVTEEHGWPDDDARQRGGVIRYFRQSSAFDAALNIAVIEGDKSVGAWIQTYVFKTTKLYADTAWRETDRILSQPVEEVARVLLGASYEGETYGTFRLEVLHNNRGLEGMVAAAPSASVTDLLSSIFYRPNYAIASVQFSDLWRESSFTLNHIRAFDYPEWLWMARYEVPVTGHQLVGTTLARFHGLATMPDATLITLDWKYSY